MYKRQINISSKARVKNTTIIILGNNHLINIDERSVIKDSEFWLEDSNNSVILGKIVRMNGVHLAVTEINTLIKIGDDCLFSKGIDIRTGDSHSIIDLESNKKINFASNVIIGDHVWIGKDVTILKSSVINSNSIVGTKSLVAGVIPANSLAAGIPAKVIKSNISWDIERFYEPQ